MTKKLLSALLLLVIAWTACNNKSTDDTFFPDAPTNPDKDKLVELVNAIRATGQQCGSQKFGTAQAVTWNDTLAVVAKKHSEDMFANDKLSHTGTNGSFVDERIEAEGYVYSYYAENLLKGGETEEQAIKAWQESPAHCENLLDPNIREIGIATAGPYWTMVLASH
jgi:uncharacterized protein YkwD